MKTTRSILAFVLAVAASAIGSSQENRAVVRDLLRLQGEWSLVSGTADGYPIPDSMLSSSKRVCKGDEIIATVGGRLVMKAKITIDPAKSPKTIDYQVIDGPTRAEASWHLRCRRDFDEVLLWRARRGTTD
jgi:uncharacterized protein (TIGR03067 family)